MNVSTKYKEINGLVPMQKSLKTDLGLTMLILKPMNDLEKKKLTDPR